MHQRELSKTKGLKSIFPTSFSLSLPFCKSSIKRNVFFFGFVSGLTRPALYPFPATQYAYPMLSPEMTAASWHTPSMYSAASGFRGPYPTSLPINTSLSRYSFVLYVQVFFSRERADMFMTTNSIFFITDFHQPVCCLPFTRIMF